MANEEKPAKRTFHYLYNLTEEVHKAAQQPFEERKFKRMIEQAYDKASSARDLEKDAAQEEENKLTGMNLDKWNTHLDQVERCTVLCDRLAAMYEERFGKPYPKD